MDIITLSPSLELLLALMPVAMGAYSFFTGHQELGLAIFKSRGNQVLPQSISNNQRILIIEKELW